MALGMVMYRQEGSCTRKGWRWITLLLLRNKYNKIEGGFTLPTVLGTSWPLGPDPNHSVTPSGLTWPGTEIAPTDVFSRGGFPPVGS